MLLTRERKAWLMVRLHSVMMNCLLTLISQTLFLIVLILSLYEMKKRRVELRPERVSLSTLTYHTYSCVKSITGFRIWACNFVFNQNICCGYSKPIISMRVLLSTQNISWNCLGQFCELLWNQTMDVHRGSTLITRVLMWRWRYLKRLSLQPWTVFEIFYFVFRSFVKVELSYVFTINLFTIAENCTEKWIIL